MYRLFISFLQPDNEVTQFVYEVAASTVPALTKALNRDKFLLVQPSGPEASGIVVPIPTDRIVLAEFIPLAIIELQALRRQQEKEQAPATLSEFLLENPALAVVPPPAPVTNDAATVGEG